ncbi:MAG: hypothetical protein Tsb0020_16150 [Haliangiales bacterium]
MGQYREHKRLSRKEVDHAESRATKRVARGTVQSTARSTGDSLVQCKAVATGDTHALPPKMKTAWEWTTDPWMDAAHRGTAPPELRGSSPVQAKGDMEADTDEQIHRAAEIGVSGSGGALPHLGPIQESFGPDHDVSHVRAHIGGQAADASAAIGASAYATGDRVAFQAPPDLHTAAHEAAHVIQQQQGVQLQGGVGEIGDAYERHADAVAERVVAGQFAGDLLASGPASTGGSATATATSDAIERVAHPTHSKSMEKEAPSRLPPHRASSAPGHAVQGSFISFAVKAGAKQAAKGMLKNFIKTHIKSRIRKIAIKKFAKRFAREADQLLDILEDPWWVTAVGFIPVAGDAFDLVRVPKQIKRAIDKADALEAKVKKVLEIQHRWAETLIPATLKRSDSYFEEFAKKSYAELVSLASSDQRAAKMKKLIEQQLRLMEKL